MSFYTLHDYQEAALEALRASEAKGIKRNVLVKPTGSGKTILAIVLMELDAAAGKSVLFTAPRRELIDQTSSKMTQAGIRHGVIMADREYQEDPDARIQLASVDTLQARMRSKKLEGYDRNFSRIIIDEAHLGITKKRQELVAELPHEFLTGLTATPSRGDNRSLAIFFDRLIQPITMQELIDRGKLVRPRYFSPSEPDLSKVRIDKGEFKEEDFERVMVRPEVIGDVVAHYTKHCPDRKAVVFCVNVKHSVSQAEEFIKAGVVAEHVDADTPSAQRDAIFERFRKGETRVLCNCFLASYGLDIPDMGAVIMARPTRSVALYIQMGGRGLRTADGKVDCIILDHAGNVARHGLLEEHRAWTLDGDYALEPPPKRPKGEKEEPKVLTCPECSCSFTGVRVCPECGYVFVPKGRLILANEGELIELHAKQHQERLDEHRRQHDVYAMLRAIGAEKGRKDSWAAYAWKEMLSQADFPPWAWKSEPLIEPSQEVRGWVTSRDIAWRKEQAKARMMGGAQ
jgi:superfamily II DNA or RNA helicase